MLGRKTALIGLATLLATVAFTGPAATAAVPKQVIITSGPTVNADNSVTLGYSINRWPRAIKSRTCTVDTATTHAFVYCGALKRPPANPTAARVTLAGLAEGTYTFTVRVRFKDGRRVSATSTPFTIAPKLVLDQSYTGERNTRFLSLCNGIDYGQSFTAGVTGTLRRLTFYGVRTQGPQSLTIEVRTSLDGLPTDTILGGGTYSGPGDLDGFDVDLANPAPLTQGTQYAVLITCPRAAGWGELSAVTPPGYPGGIGLFNNYDVGTGWADSEADLFFQTWMGN